jgi:hypothetical protein
MIGRLYGWISQRSRRLAPVCDEDLTPYQRDCERRLLTALSAVGHSLQDRTLVPEPDGRIMVRAMLSGTEVEIELQPDGAAVRGPDVRLDFAGWSAHPPAEVSAALVDAVMPIVTNVRAVH